MKTIKITLAATFLAAAALTLTSCRDDFFDGINGIGEITTNTVEVDAFDGINNMISADVYLSQGTQRKVEIVAQQNIIDNIKLEVVNDTWRISYYESVHLSKPVKIYITVPSLTSVVLSGSGSVYGETAFDNLEKLSLVISGSGSMDLESNCKNLDLLISGSGSFTLAGSTNTVEALVSGSGDINAFDLTSKAADITITGSGSVEVTSSEVLDVTISGSGSVYYKGSPQVNASVSGSGRVRHS